MKTKFYIDWADKNAVTELEMDLPRDEVLDAGQNAYDKFTNDVCGALNELLTKTGATVYTYIEWRDMHYADRFDDERYSEHEPYDGEE